MTTQHTPGPWHLIHSDGQLRVDSERDGAVAVCHTLMRGEFKMPSECVANARLIAAAPDLLAALEELLPIAARSIQGTTDGEPILQAARAAIVQAIGEDFNP